MTEPIVVLVKRYGCPTCGRTSSRPSRAKEHMARCWANPENRACKTCKHHDRDYEDGSDTCAAGEDLEIDPRWADLPCDPTEPNGHTYLRVHCPKWEADS